MNSPQPDPSRRLLVRLVFVIYVLLLFEGVLRKWLLPEFSRVLFFVRDPFLLALYAAAAARPLRVPGRRFLAIGMAMGGFALVLLPAQSASLPDVAGGGWLLAAYGWRNYFLYLPLAFIVGATFDAQDTARLMRLTLWLALPVALLVAVQFFSAVDARINVGSASDVAAQFRGLGTDETHTRPMGLFTSDLGQKQFAVSALAMLMATWLLPPARRAIGRTQLLLSTGAIAVCAAVSGSRGLMLHGGIVLLAALSTALLSREAAVSRRSLAMPLLLLGVAALAIPFFLPEAIAAFATRWTTAYSFESRYFSTGIFGRALYGLVDFVRLLGDTPLQGYGLGLGGNASTLLGARVDGHLPVSLAETDWARHIVDLGPVLGLLFVIFRIVLVAWVGVRAVAATRRGSDPLPLLLFAYVATELLQGQITGQGTINGYVWLFTGLSLAASREKSGSGAVTSPVAGRPAARFANLMR